MAPLLGARGSVPAARLDRELALDDPAHLQRLAQPLVLHEGAMADPGDPIEGAVGEGGPLVADLDPTIGETEDRHLLADQGPGDVAGLKDEHHPVVLNRERMGDGALVDVLRAGQARPAAGLEVAARTTRARIVLIGPVFFASRRQTAAQSRRSAFSAMSSSEGHEFSGNLLDIAGLR